MNILGHALIFLLFVSCYSALNVTRTAAKVNFTTLEVAGTPLKLKSYFSTITYDYGIVPVYRGKSCYHICGARRFVQASHFYDLSSISRGYIELKNNEKASCHKFYELNATYSFLEGNDDFCFCVTSHIQNIFYVVAGFPNLYFPPTRRKFNESQFYNMSWDPEDHYMIRSPCDEKPSCSVRVDPYLVNQMDLHEKNTLVTPKKRSIVSELDRVQRDVEAMKTFLGEAKMTHEQITREKEVEEMVLKAMRENLSALRQEIALEQIKKSNLSSLSEDLKRENSQLANIKVLKDEIERLKAVDEETADFKKENEILKNNLEIANRQLKILEDNQNKRNMEMVQINDNRHALQNDFENLKLDCEAKNQALEELERTNNAYNEVRERFDAQENLHAVQVSALQKSLQEVKEKLEMALTSKSLVVNQLENAQSQNTRLEENLNLLSEEKKTLENEKRHLEETFLNAQKENGEASTNLTICLNQVDDLRKESMATLRELEELQQNQTEELKKECEEAILQLEEEIRSKDNEIRDTRALFSKYEEENKNREEKPRNLKLELAQSRNENMELLKYKKENSSLLEDKENLQKEVITLENEIANLKREISTHEVQLEFISKNFETVSREKEELSQKLKEKNEAQMILQQLQLKFNDLEMKRNILDETFNGIETSASGLTIGNHDLKSQILTISQELEKLDGVIQEREKLQNELKMIKAEKLKAEEDMVGAQTNLTKLKKENDDLQQVKHSNEEMRKRILTLEQETTRTNATLNEFIIKNRQINEALSAAQEKVRLLGSQKNDEQKALKEKIELENELNSTKNRLLKLEQETTSTNATLNEFIIKNRQINEALSVAQAKVQSLGAQNSDMKKSLEEKNFLEAELNSTKKTIEEVRGKLAEIEMEKSQARKKSSLLKKELETKSPDIAGFESKKSELDLELNLNNIESSAQSKSMEPLYDASKNSPCQSQNKLQEDGSILHGPERPTSCPFRDSPPAQKSTPGFMSIAVSHPVVPEDDESNTNGKIKNGSQSRSGSVSSPYAIIFVLAIVLATLA